MSKGEIIVGLVGIGVVALVANKYFSSSPVPSNGSKYSYNITVNNLLCKHWQFIESRPYNIVLNNGESITLNITYSLPPDKTIDIVDIRFHNICSTTEGHGMIYAYVNGKPALPTIGISNTKIPIYLGFPSCPNYGTVFTTVWDTDDVKGNGTFQYVYTYEGNTPLYVKSLELYVTNKLG